MEDNKFVKGLFCKMPNKAAPDFVLLDVSFKVGEFAVWMEGNIDNKGWVNIQILRSKDGSKLYGKLNDWKPTNNTVDADTGEAIPDLTDTQKINNTTAQKLFGKDMTQEDHDAMANMKF